MNNRLDFRLINSFNRNSKINERTATYEFVLANWRPFCGKTVIVEYYNCCGELFKTGLFAKNKIQMNALDARA